MDPCSKETEINKLLHAVYGNGEPGMKIDIALIKQTVQNIPTATQMKVYSFLGGAFGAVCWLGASVLLKKYGG